MKIRITDDIRNRFKTLQTNGDLNGIIEYLSSMLTNSNVDNILAGFCYWNISDSYAMQRKPNELYNIHLAFCKLLDNMDSKYKFWAVCDATQRFTLELGGYADFWWELYKNAVQVPCTAETERIIFDTHVTAISINPRVEIQKSNLELAREDFSKFVKESQNTENVAFYKLVYSSLILKGFGDEEFDILNLCNEIMPFLNDSEVESKFAVGEWERLTAQRSRHNMAGVGINRAINALIDVGKTETAKDLYHEALKNGLNTNSYITKRLNR